MASRRNLSTLWRYFLAACIPLMVLACNDQCGGSNEWMPDGDADSDSDGDPTGCVDLDGDGYGRNCEAGTDCDDGDPERHANCTLVEFGEGTDHPWDPRDDNSNGVIVDEDGGLTLDAYPEIEPAVWIANADEGTITRLDAVTGRQRNDLVLRSKRLYDTQRIRTDRARGTKYRNVA